MLVALSIFIYLRAHMNVQIVLTSHLFGFEEILCVRKEHLLHARVKDNTRHRPLVARIGPSPASMRICEVDLNTVDSFSLVLPLGL